jgi:L-iditol 2-dehydrogenase
MSIRAVEISRVGKAGVVEIDEAELGPGDVRVAVSATGICGSDISAYKGRHPYRVPPVITGHEAVGVISEVGPGVDGPVLGSRVVIEPHEGCGTCAYCRSGDYNLCHKKRVLGTREWAGTFAESIVVPVRCAHPIPDELPDAQAALVEPLSVGVHAAAQGEVSAGAEVAILGCGTIGLLLLLAVLERDPSGVICSDIKALNLDMAEKLGAGRVVDAGREPVAEAILAETVGRGADVTFVAFASDEVMEQALAATRRKGRIVVIATFSKPARVDLQKLFYEREVVGTCMYVEQDYRNAIDLANREQQALARLITHRIGLDDLPVMLDNLSSGRVQDVVKVLVG